MATRLFTEVKRLGYTGCYTHLCQIACNSDPHFASNRDPHLPLPRLIHVMHRRDPRPQRSASGVARSGGRGRSLCITWVSVRGDGQSRPKPRGGMIA